MRFKQYLKILRFIKLLKNYFSLFDYPNIFRIMNVLEKVFWGKSSSMVGGQLYGDRAFAG